MADNTADSCLDFWNDNFWNQGRSPWHIAHPHKQLVAHQDALFGNGQVRVLVPLCGKTVDMKYIYDLGHEVVGVEGSSEAIELFFKESGIEYTVCDDKITYQSLDKKLTIVKHNFFTLAGDWVKSFDCVWDRAALVAILPEDRATYVDAIKRLTKKSFKYLLVTLDYEQSKVDGPPFSVPLEEVKQLFQGFAKVEQLSLLEQKPGGQEYIAEKFIQAGVTLKELTVLLTN
ncbi:Thiopurine S-methyltransferase [Halotydeus destructor]|nr:Thiopurine S-methyltransferase [Halotydeus destructor]